MVEAAEAASADAQGGQNTAGTPIRNLGYRNGGDMYGQQFVGGSTFEYGYSARKRLVSVKKDGAVTATYGYDFQGRRVWRNLPGAAVVETHYVFDTAGHVLAEYNGWSGVLLKEYAWIDDMPVAMVDYTSGSAVSYFIHTGPTGEPQMMTDVAKTKVWDVAVDPFGKVSPLSTGTKDLAMRLPGQWLQAEMADLYQNQWRHYDPSLGRYIETDPLGLEAGQNVYAYVDGRPLEWVDPEGRIGFLAPIVVGALIGGGIDLAIQLWENDGDWSCVNWWRVGGNAALGGAFGFGTELLVAKYAARVAPALAEAEGVAATGFRGSKGFELKNAPYQKVRNAPGQVNERAYSGHAFDQMQNRGIMPSAVENAIGTGSNFSTRAGTLGYYDAVNGIRVIMNSKTGQVVTVIRGAP